MITAVITPARGRHDHLRRQLEGLTRSTLGPDMHVVVAMDDPRIADVVAEQHWDATIVTVDAGTHALPVAAARNAGAHAAIAGGADLLIFLDVDCIPAAQMVDGYQQAASDDRHRRALLCATVSYLPPPPAAGYDLDTLPALAPPHPARPAPLPGQVLTSTDYHLFWSLAFAVTTPTWRRIGGFHTGYAGYGGEDTDFAQLAAAADVPLRWVGAAQAFHQYHPVSDPPVEHLAEIVTNARLFFRRWGWWPMSGWLRAFAEQGLVHWQGSELRVSRSDTDDGDAAQHQGHPSESCAHEFGRSR